jgi:hypothetical protein
MPLSSGDDQRQGRLSLLHGQVQLGDQPTPRPSEAVVVGLDEEAAGRLLLQFPILRAPAACWWARAIVESTLTPHVIRPKPRPLIARQITTPHNTVIRYVSRNSTAGEHGMTTDPTKQQVTAPTLGYGTEQGVGRCSAGRVGQHGPQVSFAEDRHAVGEFGSGCEHESFGKAVRSRAARWDLHGLDTRVGQDGVPDTLPRPVVVPGIDLAVRG